jgi:acid phosphatase
MSSVTTGLLAAAAVGCAAELGEAGAAEGSAASAGAICAVPGAEAVERLEHVIVVVLENKDASWVARSGQAPYFDSLLEQCASSSAYVDDTFAADLPSLPHYLALTSGSNCDTGVGTEGSGCITDNDGPHAHRLHTRSIFDQAGSWRAYMEDMPGNCDWGNPAPGTNYTVKHNPPAYYADLGDCWEHDVGIARVSCPSAWNATCTEPANRFVDDLRRDALAEYTLVVPDLVNDMHDGTIAQADNWLHTYLPLVFRSPAYQRGATAVYVLWDEEGAFDAGPMPNLFVAPSIRHTVSSARMNHFAALRAMQDQLGVEPLGCAGGTPPGGLGRCPDGSTTDLRAIFGF